MHHSLDICCDIAEKLKDPEKISQKINEMGRKSLSSGKERSDFSLITGLPGIIYFYAMMNLNFEDRYTKVAHEYLLYAKNHLETEGYDNASLFYGLSGLSCAVYLCSNQGKRYGKMLSKLDEFLIQEIREKYLYRLDHYLDPNTPLPASIYDLASGLSGIISYLLLRYDLRELTTACVTTLVKILSTPKTVDSYQVVPWLIPSDSVDSTENENCHNTGFYRLEVAYGITGALGTLSQAAIKGVRVNGLHELISVLSEWIRRKQIVYNGLINWNRSVAFENHFTGEKIVPEKSGDNWQAGAPGISRCLYMASKALNSSELALFSENVFLSHLHHFFERHQDFGSPSYMNQAGLLSLAYQMGCVTEKPIFFKMANEIEERLKRHYNPLHEFGFQSITIHPDGRSEWIDDPSLHLGSTGVGLSLLHVQGRVQTPWNQTFLISV